MATKVVRVDDIDGSEGEDVHPRRFEVGGTEYEVDLSDANFKVLESARATLDQFIDVARIMTKPRKPRKKEEAGPLLSGGHTNTDVREWAAANDIDVSLRGRIHADVYEKYYAAHPDSRPANREAADSE